MNIYELRPQGNLPKGDNPWEPWYDKSFGFIVTAESEEEARKLAHDNAGDENRNCFLGKETSKTRSPWLDENYSTCCELIPNEKKVVMNDFASA